MGLAASQGRLLSLTARNHDLVYEGQQISQQRLMLAEATQEVANKYNKAMNNTVMQAVVNGQTQPLTYDVLTSQDPFSGLCMRLVDTHGNVVIPGESIEVQQTVKEEGTQGETKSIVGRFTSSYDFINAYMKDLSDDKKAELYSSSLANVFSYYNDSYDNKNENITVIHRNKNNNSLIKDGEKALIDSNIYDSEYLHQMLIKGEFKLQQSKPDGRFEDLVWQGSTMISEVFDTSDDAVAEAEYETALTELQRQDKILELRLDQVETQQSAVHQELESVKKVIKENVEDSFKTMA